MTAHGLAWQDMAASLQVLKEVAHNRLKRKSERLEQQNKEIAAGALPTPRPAEEILFPSK